MGELLLLETREKEEEQFGKLLTEHIWWGDQEGEWA